MKYYKQLDSLRGIAVLMVIYSHWLDNWRVGQIGVNIFFTLSGFLITKILLQNRLDSELISYPKIDVIKNFYLKRVLRIFPIYYLTLLLFIPLSSYFETPIRLNLMYYFTFTSNIIYFLCQCFDGSLTHFWSLAVEEQFYLVWPWVIIFLPKRFILTAIFTIIFVGIFSQIIFLDNQFSRFMTFQSFDAFGIGALVSWMSFDNNKMKEFSTQMLILGSIYLNFCFILNHTQFNYLYFMPDRTISALFTAAFISYILLRDETGIKFIDTVLNNRWLVFCGKISYGLYLYHNFVPEYFYRRIINIYVNPHLPSFFLEYVQTLKLIENIIVVTVLALFSYYFIERPILKLKSKFEITKVS